MSMAYKWGWQIDPKLYALSPSDLTSEELGKRQYVHQYLDPSVREAGCGWHGIVYLVCCEDDGENRREYVLMFADKNDTPLRARWIDVTHDSKGAIAETVWGLVFA